MTLSPNEIKNLKVGQLRLELEARNLPTDGLKNVLALRLMQHCFNEVQNQQQLANPSSGSTPLTDQDMMASTTKNTSGTKRRNAGGDLLRRVKKSLESSLLEYVCPISRGLPLDPVIAMDGQIYERSEIMMWIDVKKSKSESVTSPLTNNKMGKTLIDAPRVYNAIEKLIIEDEINSDLAKSWLQRVKDRKAEKRAVSALLAEANAGDCRAMYNLALWYDSGKKGLPMDLDQAVHWYKKSSDSNYPPGMFAYGLYLVCPEGKIKKNIQYGTFLVARAASEGSSYACYTVGKWYRDGEHGFPKDIEQTKRYFCLVAHEYCEYDDMYDEHVEEVKKWLDDNE